MATIAQCKFCSKPFHSIGGKVCPNCLDEIDEDYVKIRDYIYDNPGKLDIDAVCEATGVHKKVVLYLLEEKRLIFSTPVSGGLSCSICHRPISEGAMCDSCKKSLSNTLNSVVAKPAVQKKAPLPSGGKTAKMHLKRDDGRN